MGGGKRGGCRSPHHAWEPPKGDGGTASQRRADRWVHKAVRGSGTTLSPSAERSCQSKKIGSYNKTGPSKRQDEGHIDEVARAEWFDSADKLMQPKPGRLASYTLSPTRAGMSQPPQNPRVVKDLLEYFASSGVPPRIATSVPSPRLHLVRPGERDRSVNDGAGDAPIDSEHGRVHSVASSSTQLKRSQALPQIHSVSSFEATGQLQHRLGSPDPGGSFTDNISRGLRGNHRTGSKDKGSVKFNVSPSVDKVASAAHSESQTKSRPSALRRPAPPGQDSSVFKSCESLSSVGSAAVSGFPPSSAAGSRKSMGGSDGFGKMALQTRSLPCLTADKRTTSAPSAEDLDVGTTQGAVWEDFAADENDDGSAALNSNSWRRRRKTLKTAESRQPLQDYRAPGTPTDDQMRWSLGSLKMQSRMHSMNFVTRRVDDALDLTLHHNKAARLVTEKRGGLIERVAVSQGTGRKSWTEPSVADYVSASANFSLKSLTNNFLTSIERAKPVKEDDPNRPIMLKEMKAILAGIKSMNNGVIPPPPADCTRSRLAQKFWEVGNIARMAALSTGIVKPKMAGQKFRRLVGKKQVLIEFKDNLKYMDAHRGSTSMST